MRRVAVDPEATNAALPLVQPPADAIHELVACPACGSSNAARRRRCGRCGTALGVDRPGEVQSLPVEPEPEDVAEPAWEPAAVAVPVMRRRGLGAAIVVLGVVLGTGVGLAAGLRLGPFASVQPVPFDMVAYPQDPETLRPATAVASSTAPAAGDREFLPEQTTDGDLTTAWRPDGQVRGALLRHAFVAPVWVDTLEIATGDQRDEATFADTPRVTGVLVDLGTVRLDVTVAGMDGVQVVPLPEPVLVDEVTWEVTDTTGGVGAISEVRYVGWQADEEDRQAFRRRQ